jgi:hypothetical protein
MRLDHSLAEVALDEFSERSSPWRVTAPGSYGLDGAHGPPIASGVVSVHEGGQHRGPSVSDLIIAATAGLTVLHCDKHFNLIADVTGQPAEWLSPS